MSKRNSLSTFLTWTKNFQNACPTFLLISFAFQFVFLAQSLAKKKFQNTSSKTSKKKNFKISVEKNFQLHKLKKKFTKAHYCKFCSTVIFNLNVVKHYYSHEKLKHFLKTYFDTTIHFLIKTTFFIKIVSFA